MSSPKMDLSPTTIGAESRSPPINSLPSPDSLTHASNSQLATLLSESCRETEALRRDLASTRKRAEKAERLLTAFQSLSSPPDTSPNTSKNPSESANRVILEFEERAVRAERARDEAEARKRMMMETWSQLERYLQVVEIRAADARAGFSRIVAEGGGQLVLTTIPLPGGQSLNVPPPQQTIHQSGNMPPPLIHPSRHHVSQGPPSRNSSSLSQRAPTHTPGFPTLPLPPLPNPNPNSGSRVRPRSESLDGPAYLVTVPGQPPTKKSRSDRDDRRAREERAMFSDSHLSQHSLPALQHNQHPHIDAREREYLEHFHQRGRHTPHAQPQHPPRMINPSHGATLTEKYPRHRSRSASPRSHSRSLSRSSISSLSVDEMLLQATTGEERSGPIGTTINGNGGGTPPLQVASIRHRHHRHRDREHRSSSTHSLSRSRHLHSTDPYTSQPPPPAQPQQQPHRYRGDSPSSEYRSHASQSQHPSSAPHRLRGSTSSSSQLAGVDGVGPLPQPGQVQTYQTHVFAPVVTGAPVKKSKFVGSGGSGAGQATAGGSSLAPGVAVENPPPAPPAPAFPPTNAAGQRICRQCGLPGRYKDGKCVEKWGPGPQGPGTVCDRCRKKMKRVERRGTLDSQQNASNASIASLQAQSQQQTSHATSHPRNAHSISLSQSSDRPIHRSDTLPTHQSHQLGPGGTHLNFSHSERNRDREESVLRTALSHSSSKSIRAPPSPPTIAILADDAASGPTGRGGSTSRAQSRSNSRNGRRQSRPASHGLTPPIASEINGAGSPSKRSPFGSEHSNGGKKGSKRTSASPVRMEVEGEVLETDADADADADVDAEVEPASGAAVEGAVGVDGDADADAEADLLEAVDAAEANSNGSSAGGTWLKSEDI